MFKIAYTRGVTKALLVTGAIKIANEELAEAVAAEGAETLPEQPVEEVAPEATADLAANLIELSNSLQESAGNAAQAAEAVAGGGEAAPEAEVPMASEEEVAKAASVLRRKLALAETGSTITGDRPEQQNTPANSTNAETKLDESNRPGGDQYANVGEDGVGMQQASGEGAIASEKPHPDPKGMGPSEGGTNSATEAVKGASIRELIKKVAMGTTIDGGPQTANAQTGEGQMETGARPAEYAAKGEDGVGKSDQAAAERAAAVGSEGAHPKQEAHTGGTNTAIQQIAGGKVAEDEEYMSRFRAVGHKYASALPFYLNEMQKVSAIQYLMGVSPQERSSIVSHIDKTAELPEGLKDYLASKGDKKEEKDEKKDDKKDEKKEEKKEEKEASLNVLQSLRRMA